MTNPIREPQWLSVGDTQLPQLPPRSRLVVERVSPEFFDVTYQPKSQGSLLAKLTDNKSQRIRLTPSDVFVFEDAATVVYRQCGIGPSSRFKVERVEHMDDVDYQLVLTEEAKNFLVVHESHLDEADFKWLECRFNEWLGWEFPTHCVACGRRLEACDLEWSERSVDCSECDYRGPAPDPFPDDVAPSAPPSRCPNCEQPIWLTEVNRCSGGCRCKRCDWISEATPPLVSLGSLMEVAMGLAFLQTELLIPEDAIRAEYPRKEDALRALEEEGLVQQSEPGATNISFNLWKNRVVPFTALALGVVLIILAGLLAPVIMIEHRTWTDYCLMIFCLGSLMLVAPGLGLLIWWASRRITLMFTPAALVRQIGEKKRFIKWGTLNLVAVSKGGWLPSVLLKQGGAGLTLITPSDAAAKAIARLCIEHRS